jgi:effector-binding domain-containing protein
MEREIIAPKLYFYLEGKTSLKQLMEFAAPTVDLAYAEAARLELEKTGPIEFVYFGASSDQDKEFTLQIGFPIKTEKQTDNSFQFRKSADFKCLKFNYKGPMNGIGDEYEKLYEYLWNNSIKHTDEIREIYHLFEYPDSPNNVTEIQIGLV